MSAKTPILILLGMCLSFSLVLAVVIAFRPQTPPPKRRPQVAAQHRAPTTPETPHRATTPSPEPAARPETRPATPTVGLKPMDLTPSAEAAHELDLAKKELREQIAALKKDRDQMLNNLAGQLATLPLAEAAVQLNDLDDESAALVLVRLKPDKRRALLGQLEPARAKRLTQALTPLSH
ncbi:MAG: hypothetical protein IT369_16775 [Candidatus Latescibacteria bacterium]|nr:hypothetical protein [Candidatus Latescibacterota bacterium]